MVDNALPLFSENSASSEAPRTFVISSNYTLPPLFSRGCLLPVVFGEVTNLEFFDAEPTELPAAIGQVPGVFVSRIEASARNAYPIAIEVAPDRGFVYLGLPEYEKPIPVLPLDSVQRIVFRSSEEQQRFETSSFGDLNIMKAGIELVTDAALFAPGSSSADLSKPPPVPQKAPQLEEAVRKADALAAVYATLCLKAPATRSWMEGLSDFDSHVSAGSQHAPFRLIGELGEEKTVPKTAEEKLLSSAAKVLLEMPVEKGWPTSEILNRVTEGALSFDDDQTTAGAIRDWQTYCQKQIDLESDTPPTLGDRSSSTIRRALLLLLLRGDVEALLDITVEDAKSELNVGKNVHLVALTLAAFRSGLRGLPVKLKYEAEHVSPRPWLAHLGNIFIRSLCEYAGAQKSKPQKTLRVEHESLDDGISGIWSFMRGAERVMLRSAEVDATLRRVATVSSDMGYTPSVSEDGSLEIAFSWEGENFSAWVEIVSPEEQRMKLVRFVCPLVATKKTSSPRSIGKTKKELLVSLLEANSSTAYTCRYAFDKDQFGLCAIADQPIGTMDDEEVRWHLANLARSVTEGRRILGN